MSSPALQAVRLLLVDDHAMFRESLARMLEKEPDFCVVGQAGSAADALAIAAARGATLVLLDVDLGAQRAFDFIAGAKSAGFDGKILVVTAGVNDHEAVRLVQSGVAGIVHKQQTTEVLCQAIRHVAGGEVFLEKKYLAPLFQTIGPATGLRRPSLTERDRQIMRCLLQGLTNREIGARLNISEGAAKASLHHVCQKLGVRTRSQLVKVTLEQYKEQL